MKPILLSSLTAFLFINNAMASETITNEAAIKAAITASLSSAMAQINTTDTMDLVAKQLDKQLLTLQTNQIVEEAQSGLPRNQFKVVIAD
jgi:hypothetical protein